MTNAAGRDNDCPACGDPVESWEAYCEGCGAELAPTLPPPGVPVRPTPVTASVVRPEAPADPLEAPPGPCRACGGGIDPDGYCEQCGTRAPTPRDHFAERPAAWLAGVCDRGVRHHRNEDALALAADEATPGDLAGRHGVLVVCDGVSSSADSDVASLAAARAARGVLDSERPHGMATPQSHVQALIGSLTRAAVAANEAVIASHAPDAPNPASCTFAAAIVDGPLVAYGNIGDSRVYWIADEGESRLLSIDDSVAQVQIAHGVPRERAEHGPQAHAITRWLGTDAPDLVPTSGVLQIPGDGWLVVCSDGLWNYASTADALTAVFARIMVDDPDAYADPGRLADLLVRWACDQGGRDNITVALARFGAPRTPWA